MMKSLLASVVALAVALSLAGCASPSSSLDGAAMEGTWIGQNLGYENGEYQDREIRLVVEESTGNTFAGSKSWREVGGEWSEPEDFSGAILDSTEFHAADFDGIIIGNVISATSIHASYFETGEDLAVFSLNLEKVLP